MKIGLLGLSNSGKTTIFNALTRADAAVGAYANNGAEPNVAVVAVSDERITRLAQLYHPKKTTYATIQIVDFPCLTHGAARKDDFSGERMNAVRSLDAIALVVRNFSSDLTGSPTPMADIDTAVTEFVLSDMIVAEKRMERIAWSVRRGKKTPAMPSEEKLLRKILDELYQGRRIRDLNLSPADQKLISGFQFLTMKPFFVILNSGEDNFGRDRELLAEIEEKHKVIEFAGNFEMELAGFGDTEDARLFMEGMGIAESARDRITRFAYEILDRISFITVGTDEVRAWTLRNGTTALDAAATIHSDLSRGFIRAECFSYADLMACGSEKGIRDNGHFRLEGKHYRVKDGDILNIRFNI